MLTFDVVTDHSVAAHSHAPVRMPRRPSAEALLDHLKQVLDERKGYDIATITLKGKADFADYMIVASGTSQRHVASLAESVEDALDALGLVPISVEGKESSDWVLVDAGDVVVHLFRPEARAHYNLEKMWSV